MGAALGGARKSSRGRRGVPRYGAMADINMTPFIDVMLVLLIIFMVAAPLLTSGVSVDLPQAKASALNVDQKPIAVSLNEQGQLFLMDQPIADADLTAKLQDLSGGSTAAWRCGGAGGGSFIGLASRSPFMISLNWFWVTASTGMESPASSTLGANAKPKMRNPSSAACIAAEA